MALVEHVAEVGRGDLDVAPARAVRDLEAVLAALRSSTPTRKVPPAVLAKATIVSSAPSGEERSRLDSNVLPSGRSRISTGATTLGSTREAVLASLPSRRTLRRSVAA